MEKKLWVAWRYLAQSHELPGQARHIRALELEKWARDCGEDWYARWPEEDWLPWGLCAARYAMTYRQHVRRWGKLG